MSTRTKRTSRVTREHSETFSTASGDSFAEGTHSPLQMSRLQEKEQLCSLNDRLATYIEVFLMKQSKATKSLILESPFS